MRKQKEKGCSFSLSVPPKRVLSRDRSRDETSRVARAAPPATVAIPTTRLPRRPGPRASRNHSTIPGKVPAQESPTHERRAAAAGRLPHVGWVADGAGAAVKLLLALVPTGNDKHDNTVRGRHRDGTAGNSGGGSALGSRRVVGVAARAEGVAAAAAAAWDATAGDSTDPLTLVDGAVLDGDGWVDLHGEVVDEDVGVSVQRSVGGLDVGRQGIDHGPRVRDNGAGGDVAQRALGVQRHQSLNLDL